MPTLTKPETSGRSLCVLLVNYNTRHLLDECLGKLRQAVAYAGAQISRSRVVVVDNASRDDSVEYIKAHFNDVDLMVSETNIGFGRANNLALPLVDTEFLLLLNTDAFVAPDSLAVALTHMQTHPRCGILGVRLVGRDGVAQPTCRNFPTPRNMFASQVGAYRWPLAWIWGRPIDDTDWDGQREQVCDWVPGCFYLVRREVWERVGLFDPRFFLYSEEVDHCRRTQQAGWTIDYNPATTVVHIGGESARSDGPISASGRQLEALQIESSLLYVRKHHGIGGLLLHMILQNLACGWLLARSLARRQPNLRQMGAVRFGLLWRLLARTRWATTPTR